LLEICAVTGTLILDDDGLYDPAHFNDRLLLGLKGTMSEAELHLLRARLRGGALNKAKRGELKLYLPIGLAYDAVGGVILDPDEQVRQSVQLVFATFQRTGSAFAVVREFRRQGRLFPRHQRSGPDHEQVVWKHLTYPLLTKILHNPPYAGAFVWGRTIARKSADGHHGVGRRLPGRDEGFQRCLRWRFRSLHHDGDKDGERGTSQLGQRFESGIVAPLLCSFTACLRCRNRTSSAVQPGGK
jgi:Recombinase